MEEEGEARKRLDNREIKMGKGAKTLGEWEDQVRKRGTRKKVR